MTTRAKIWTGLWCCGLAACAHHLAGTPSPQPVTLTWAADGAASTPIRYNVYAVPGTGPIPTVPSDSCGVSTVAKGRPLNSEPIVGTTYRTSLAAGLWTVAVEAVSSDGCRSVLSSPITVTVPIQADSPTNVRVEP